MSEKKPVILIGPVSDDPAESVSGVNKALIEGLEESYDIKASRANRRFGGTQQSQVNPWNLYYLGKHAILWIWNLLRFRPVVTHYAINAGWALEKGLIFLWLGRLMGAKTIGHLHSGSFIDFWKKLSPWRKRIAARQIEKLDAFVVLSESWKDTVVEHLGLDPKKIFVVNNPVSRVFESAALKMPIERPDLIILALGVMGRDKGIFEILDAAEQVRKRVPEFTLQLAGPEREAGTLFEVKTRIESKSLQDCVQVLPVVFGEEKVELFRNASIFLLPSYYENFPLVILEAAAAGQAIISTPVGATPEFFELGESALFVEIGNSDELEKAILKLLTNRDELRRLGAEARDVFTSRLSRSLIMDSMAAVYESVLVPPTTDHLSYGLSRSPQER